MIPVAIGAAVMSFAMLGWTPQASRQRVLRIAVWASVILPFMLTTEKTIEDITGGGLSGRDVLRVALPATGVALAVIFTPKRSGIRANATGKLLLAYALLALASSLWSPEPQATLLRSVHLGVHYCALIALARCYATPLKLLEHAVAACNLIALTVLVGAVTRPSEAFDMTATGSQRITGVILPIGANTVALLSLLALLAVMAEFGPRWTVRYRWMVLALHLTLIAMTQTRYVIALGAIATLYVALRKRRRSTGWVFMSTTAVSLAAVAMVIFADQLVNALSRGQSVEELSSLTGRLPLWERAVDHLQERLLFGHGYYAHRFLFPVTPGTANQQSNIDNAWLETLVNNGLLGLALLAGATIFGAFSLLRATRGVRTPIHLLSRAMLGVLLAASFVNPSLQMVGLTGSFFVILLLSYPPTSTRASTIRPAQQAVMS